jgi:hypothetical protein
MIKLTLERLNTFRETRYRFKPGTRLSTLHDAVDFVKERGFVFFWPIKGIDYPSLWTAVAGDRPIAAYHDDPGHLTWSWKDDSLGKKIWYYGKIIRKKATMIDLDVAPFFYALSENYGNPVEDILIQYHEGHLTREAKAIFDAIHESGPMDTIAIRKATSMTTKESNSRFDRAITTLQSDFKILPIGISDSGGWRYAFIYDLVHRHHPELPGSAGKISEDSARDVLVRLYFKSVGVASFRDVAKFFQWDRQNITKCIDRLVNTGELLRDVKHPQLPGDWFATPEILNR